MKYAVIIIYYVDNEVYLNFSERYYNAIKWQEFWLS